MASPSVEVNEVDLSTRVPSFPGVAGAVVVPSLRGRTDKPFLVTSQTDFLRKCTPNEKIDIGMSNAHWSALNFLEQSNQCWIMRPKNRSKFGGAIVRKNTTSLTSSMSGAVNFSGTNNILTVNSYLGKKLNTGSPIVFTNTGGALPTGLTAVTRYFVYKLSDTQFKVCENLVTALSSSPTFVSITDNGTGTHSVAVIEYLLVGDISSDFITNQDTFTISSNLGKSLQTGSEVIVSTGGTIPTGLTNNANYFVIKLSDTQIKLASSLINALANVHIEITGAGTKTFKLLAKTNNELNLVTNFTINTTNNTIVVPAQLGSLIITGDEVVLDTEGSLTGTGITAGTSYYAVKVSDTEFKISTTQANSLLSTPNVITLASTGTVNHYVKKVDGADDFESYNFDTDELMLIRAKDEGEWSKKGNSGSVQWVIEDFRNRESDSFKIKVFKTSNLVKPIEEFIVSRYQGKTDGDGRNIYVENVMKSSFYIEVIDNTSISETEFPICNSTPIGLEGGDNGDPITDGNMITALQNFANPDDVYTTLIMDGGWSTPAYQQAIETICRNRQDCFGILSVPISAEKNSDFMSAIVDYRISTNINSSYVGMFTSHQKIIDRFNNRELFVSPDGFIGAIISRTANNFEIWFPPAGWKRATMNVLEPLLKFDKGQRDVLYDNGLNPIRYKPSRGVANYGNKTMLSRPSALDRINVRMLLLQIEPANAEALEDFQFDISEVGNRSEIQSIIEDYMKDIKARDGVYDFYVVCDETNNTQTDIDNYVLNVWIFVKPTKSSEFIKLSVIITRTNSDFTVALQLV